MTATDDELIALCDAAAPGPWGGVGPLYVKMKAAIVAPDWDPLVTVAEVRTRTMTMRSFLAAASRIGSGALIEDKRHSRYLEDEAHKEINRQATEIIDLWKRLMQAEEALGRISAVSDVVVTSPPPTSSRLGRGVMEEPMPWLHVRGQFPRTILEAEIVGTLKDLKALQSALEVAIAEREGKARVIASDGEGY